MGKAKAINSAIVTGIVCVVALAVFQAVKPAFEAFNLALPF